MSATPHYPTQIGFLALIALAAAFALAAPVAAQSGAQNLAALPEGCEAFVTIQSRGCSVSHHYVCEGDAEGDQWRMDYDNDGPTYLGRIDSETQWVESYDLIAQLRETLDQEPNDPASFTALTRYDRDDFDFSTTDNEGVTTNYKGRDLLTGRTVIIDDVPLLETETFARATDEDGNLIWESTGNEYIHLDWRIFISGKYVTRTPDDEFDYDHRPAEFVFPGEEGFLSVKPEFDCDTLLL